MQATFFGGVDHALLGEYKVFVNPSLSEVLCTTIVEVRRDTALCHSVPLTPTCARRC